MRNIILLSFQHYFVFYLLSDNFFHCKLYQINFLILYFFCYFPSHKPFNYLIYFINIFHHPFNRIKKIIKFSLYHSETTTFFHKIIPNTYVQINHAFSNFVTFLIFFYKGSLPNNSDFSLNTPLIKLLFLLSSNHRNLKNSIYTFRFSYSYTYSRWHSFMILFYNINLWIFYLIFFTISIVLPIDLTATTKVPIL